MVIDKNMIRLLEGVIESANWTEGFISSADTQCFVDCNCGEKLSVSDYAIVICPHCKQGYITEFNCYRIPKELAEFLSLQK
jgi:hypothetical protein